MPFSCNTCQRTSLNRGACPHDPVQPPAPACLSPQELAQRVEFLRFQNQCGLNNGIRNQCYSTAHWNSTETAYDIPYPPEGYVWVVEPRNSVALGLGTTNMIEADSGMNLLLYDMCYTGAGSSAPSA